MKDKYLLIIYGITSSILFLILYSIHLLKILKHIKYSVVFKKIILYIKDKIKNLKKNNMLRIR
jgi:hypothetical protein